ncbi:IS66 family transposase [Nocardia panacis]|uniref:IS66 family transposase n=1 Tax=Nocardia panacis TaxID=2340916 RepID=UPI00193A0B3D
MLERQDDYLRFTTDTRIPPDNNGSERDIRMIKIGRRSPAACAPSPEPNSSVPSAATYPPPPNTATNSSKSSSCSPRADHGCPHNLTSYHRTSLEMPGRRGGAP